MKRALIVSLLALVCVAAIVIGFLVSHRSASPRFLYSDAQKAYFVQWDSHGQGTLWATYIDPTNTFQATSDSEPVTVTKQGDAVSIQIASASPVLGQLDGGSLNLSIDNSTGFGPWIESQLNFKRSSLASYETAASGVQQNGAAIVAQASKYASQAPIDANGHTLSDGDECSLYLSGTDVSIVMHAQDSLANCASATNDLGNLGTGGSWSTTQIGENYPGQATLVCQYADAKADDFIAVNDAGLQEYGTSACSALGNGNGWFQIH
jgi:hypothetical protein